MKNLFNIIIIVACIVTSILFYYVVMGDASNFQDGDIHKPLNTLGMIYTGGFLVSFLVACTLVAITYSIERFLSLNKIKGAGNMGVFGRKVIEHIEKDQYDEALRLCNDQKGSLANILRAAIERFKKLHADGSRSSEQITSDVQRVIDENMNLETPLLEKNLVILSTVASISTMIGLLGTTIGMIKAFQALGAGGTVSAQMLSIGISEALYNTAGGLLAAIIAIVAYNFFTTKADNFIYTMDEVILDLMETLTIKTGGKLS